MIKFLVFFLFLIASIFSPNLASAQTVSVVSVVNPIRGNDFWELKDQKIDDAVLGQLDILKKEGVNGTWLLRYDALKEDSINRILKGAPVGNEIGLLLEVTPTWTNDAGVKYHQTEVWHFAGSVFLTGYENNDRLKLVDTSFEEFKKVYGFYPKSVGAWWMDSYSLEYMQKKYGVTGALIVADQYTTDNYQIWGQYFGTPYYPYNKNTLLPAQKSEEKIDLVVMQWAPRDPVNGYGNGVQESTYSVQANDYTDYHDLDINYFSKLLDTYLDQSLNEVNHVVIGLENSYSWQKYKNEYQKQIETVSQKRSKGVQVLTMSNFANLYMQKIPEVSSTQVIFSRDILGSNKQTVWFMNPYYRVGWFVNNEGSVFRDVRQYISGQAEPCYEKVCEALNFATSATRVLDDVSFNQRLLVDQGSISDLEVKRVGEDIVITYTNAAGKLRTIKFLPRDIAIDEKINTIDGFILNAVKDDNSAKVIEKDDKLFKEFKISLFNFIFNTFKFLVFVFIVLLIPGYLIIKGFGEKSVFNYFSSIVLGMVILTLLAFVTGYIKSVWLIIPVFLITLGWFFYKKYYKGLAFDFSKIDLFSFGLILAGTFFQTLATFRSGWVYEFGIYYFGPIGHDGVWHQALVGELLKNIPPNNPGYAGQILNNYHYFYDLLVAVTAFLTQVSTADLIYRFYPVLFSILLGFGCLCLGKLLFKEKLISVFILFFIYFGSSFGWIIDVLKKREIGGESAFWVNQPVSMNINPPFAVSLLILLGGLILFIKIIKIKDFSVKLLLPLILLWGVLIEFKVYGGVIVLGALGILSILSLILKREVSYLKIFIPSLLLSLVVFLPQNSQSGSLLVFSPFWFVHSMVDFSDRVGWERLSLARQAYLARGEWVKLILAEVLSLFIFLAGNLGTRILAILGLVRIRDILKRPEHGVIILMILVSFAIPVFFIQKGNPWNTIQFMYYGLFLISVYCGVVLFNIYKSLPKVFGLGLILTLILITPISSLATFKNGFSNKPPSRVPLGEIEALEKLKALPEGIVLTYPYNKDTNLSNERLRKNFSEPFPLLVYETSNYVSAFSNKPSYLEDEIQQQILQTDYKKRLVAANDFFRGRSAEWSQEFLKSENINYIYLPKVFNISLQEDKLNIKKVFENNFSYIYQVNR